MEALLAGIANVSRAERPEELDLFGSAHDVDQIHPIGLTDLDQHLPQIGCRSGMHDAGVALGPHGVHHRQRRQRVDETRRSFSRRRPVVQHQAVLGRHHPVLAVHGTAEYRHRLAEQCLRAGIRTGAYDSVGPFVAARQRLAYAAGESGQRRWRNGGGDSGLPINCSRFDGGDICTPKQQTEVGGVDRRGLDSNQHIAVGQGWRVDLRQAERDLTVCRDRGLHLEHKRRLEPC